MESNFEYCLNTQLLVSKEKKIGQENDDDTMVEMKYKYCDI